jgi:hypothetical protein
VRPFSSFTSFTHEKSTPLSLPFSTTKAFGGRLLMIGIPSDIASSFSHSEAFITLKPERTMTVTSDAPRRFDVRQQSIDVLPPPSTITFPWMDVVWPNATLDSQSIPI